MDFPFLLEKPRMEQKLPHKGFIDQYRDALWSMYEDHMCHGAIYVNAKNAEQIHHVTYAGVSSLFPNASWPDDGSMMLLIDYDDHVATFHVSRFGGQSLIKKYMKDGKDV